MALLRDKLSEETLKECYDCFEEMKQRIINQSQYSIIIEKKYQEPTGHHFRHQDISKLIDKWFYVSPNKYFFFLCEDKHKTYPYLVLKDHHAKNICEHFLFENQRYRLNPTEDIVINDYKHSEFKLLESLNENYHTLHYLLNTCPKGNKIRIIQTNWL